MAVTLTDEERRALVYRERVARQEQRDRARRAALAGNATARRTLAEGWQPLKDYLDADDPHGDGVLR